MEWITPGIQKKRVKNIFNINAPILPVVSMASGGSKKHRKYRIAVVLMFKPFRRYTWKFVTALFLHQDWVAIDPQKTRLSVQ